MDEDLFANLTQGLQSSVTDLLQPERDIFQANDSLFERAQFNLLGNNDSFLFNTRPSEQELDFLGSGGPAPSLLPALQGFRTFEFSQGQDRDRLAGLIGDARTRRATAFEKRARQVQEDFNNRFRAADLELQAERARLTDQRQNRQLDQTDAAQTEAARRNRESERIARENLEIDRASNQSLSDFRSAQAQGQREENQFFRDNPSARTRGRGAAGQVNAVENLPGGTNAAPTGANAEITRLRGLLSQTASPTERQSIQAAILELENLGGSASPSIQPTQRSDGFLGFF